MTVSAQRTESLGPTMLPNIDFLTVSPQNVHWVCWGHLTAEGSQQDPAAQFTVNSTTSSRSQKAEEELLTASSQQA